MKTHKHYLSSCLAARLLMTTSQLTAANEFVSSFTENESDPISENGGFFEIGVAAGYNETARIKNADGTRDDSELFLGLDLHGAYRYKRAFIEATRGGFDGLNLGATLWQNEKWTVDFLAVNLSGTVEGGPRSTPAVTEEQKNTELVDRDKFFLGAGTRITRYFDNNRIAQFRILSDYRDSNGVFGSVRLGQQLQYGNWTYKGFLGARYNTKKYSNYLYSVSADEATALFPEFEAEDSVALEAELVVSYPITRKWVFTSDVQYTAYPSEISDSPLLADDHDVAFAAGIYYVF